jgi:hypothetical protein
MEALPEFVVSQKPIAKPAAPVPMNVVLRKDAEIAARVAYATGRRDAMLSFAEELQVLSGQFLAVDDVIDAVGKAASEFNDTITRLEQGTEQTPAEAARARLVLPS